MQSTCIVCSISSLRALHGTNLQRQSGPRTHGIRSNIAQGTDGFGSRKTTIVNRLAICRLENTGHRSNGYLITARTGEDADACCIIHGYSDGEIGNKTRPPLSAVSMRIHSFLKD